MDIFEQDRKIERETYAIINYFKLLAQAEIANMHDTRNGDFDSAIDIFCLIDGEQTAQRLIIDCRDENIDIFSNTTWELFSKLEEYEKIINSITFSKNVLIEQPNNAINTIKKVYYSGAYNMYTTSKISTPSAFDELDRLPLPEYLIEELEKLKPVQKSIGEK